MPGPFVHRIDPILGTVAGVHLWWYGLSYALGFLQIFLFASCLIPGSYVAFYEAAC